MRLTLMSPSVWLLLLSFLFVELQFHECLCTMKLAFLCPMYNSTHLTIYMNATRRYYSYVRRRHSLTKLSSSARNATFIVITVIFIHLFLYILFVLEFDNPFHSN